MINPYAAPNADANLPAASKFRLYTVKQIGIATFLGSPLAGFILMSANASRLGNQGSARTMLFWGFISTAFVLALGGFLPEHIPRAPIALGTAVGLSQIAKHLQGKVIEEKFLLGDATRASNWEPVGIGIACFIVVIVSLFAVIYLAIEMIDPI